MAANRERRSNAGNRMRALLNQEEDMEVLFEDEGIDEEFDIEGKDEEDIVDSDFDQDSADEEPVEDEEMNLAEDPEDAAARRKQKAMLTHLKTGKSSMSIPDPLASALSKPGITTKKKSFASLSGGIPSNPISKTPSRRSRLSTPTTLSATSTQPVESPVKIPAEIRKSSRRATVLNNRETEQKLLEHETRKAMLPKREKVVVQKMTQDELLEEAKKTEELNLASLQAFKAQEMEKKKVVKKKEVVMTTFVRYHSFVERVGSGPLIQELAITRTTTPPGGTRAPSRQGSKPGSRTGSRAHSVTPEGGSASTNHVSGVPQQSLAQLLAQSLMQQQQQQQQYEGPGKRVTISRDVSPSGETRRLKLEGYDRTSEPMSVDGAEMDITATAAAGTGGGTRVSTGALTPPHFSGLKMNGPSIAPKRKRLQHAQICGRNWITFVGYDDEDSPTSEWSYIEPYPEQNPTCLITGLPAKYKDPKTGIPYANKEAYKILQNAARHGYVWSNTLNAYCHDVAQVLPRGVPAGMAEALIGCQQVGEGIVSKDGDLVSAGIPGGGGGGYCRRILNK